MNFKFGPEKQYQHRELCISASGAAFEVSPSYFKGVGVGDRVSFSFEFLDDFLDIDGEVIRLDTSPTGKKLMAIRFIDITQQTQKSIDEFICDLGGYYADDPIARHEYLKKNFPNLVREL